MTDIATTTMAMSLRRLANEALKQMTQHQTDVCSFAMTEKAVLDLFAIADRLDALDAAVNDSRSLFEQVPASQMSGLLAELPGFARQIIAQMPRLEDTKAPFLPGRDQAYIKRTSGKVERVAAAYYEDGMWRWWSTPSGWRFSEYQVPAFSTIEAAEKA